jgi:hypothetical protein
VTLWARLTWQSSDAPALARELGERLGVAPRPGGLVHGALLLGLGNADLEVRPWVREGPDDMPRREGRLLLEPVPDGEAAPEPTASDPMVLHAVGWATVELDRAEAELEPWLGPPAPGPRERSDPHLGARVVVRAGGGLPGTWTALLEPSTEGGTSASLARDGEGPVALYLRPAAGLEAWIRQSVAAPGGRSARGPLEGPFGRQVVLPGPFTGPHIVITEGREPAEQEPPAGTIPA